MAASSNDLGIILKKLNAIKINIVEYVPCPNNDIRNCGIIVPITGFAHAMMSAALEYRKEGLILGLGSNIFKITGSVILYGVVSAYVFGLIRILVIGG